METPLQNSTRPPQRNPSEKTPLQFSVRALLIATAIVSLCLAVGVHFAGVVFVIVTVGLLQAATFLAADWLNQPANRSALAFVTAGTWLALGSGLIVIGGSQIYGVIGDDDATATWTLGLCLIAGGAFCYYIASRRWRGLSRERSAR